MTLSISFYDGVKYHGPDFNKRDADFYGNGVINPATSQFSLTYPSTPNMTFNVGTGVAWVDGYRIANDSNTVTLTVPAADTTNPRIDIVQLGHDDINSTYSLVVKKGVAAASPIEPGADTNYIKLYAVNVAANATSITSANVTDRRALLTLNVNGSQIQTGGNVSNTDPAYTNVKNGAYVVAGAGIATTAGTNQETVAVSPATSSAIGGVKVGSGISVQPDGTISVTPYTLPSDVAKTDVAQTWTGVQTWASGQTFAWSALTGVPNLAKYDTAQTWTQPQTFNGGLVSNAGRFIIGGVDGSNNMWFGTGKTTEPGDLAFGWMTDTNGNVTQITIKHKVATDNSTVDDGTGKSTWAGLMTLNGGATLPNGQTLTLNGTVSGTSVGGNNGLATLDANGQVPSSQLKNASIGAANPNLWIG